MNAKNHIWLRERDIKRFLRDLTLLVTSLDRLGSEFCDDHQARVIETDKFLTDADAFKLLAQMRKILSEAYDSQRTKLQVQQLENELDKVTVWRKRS